MTALAGLLVVMLIWLAWRMLSPRSRKIAEARSPVVTSVLDREDVTADQLPENEWLRLARELLAKGEIRLALRALFLGSLAGLAGRGLLVLARHKSNRDYERELGRRGMAAAEMARLFGENRRAFERVWYGGYVTAAEEVAHFQENVRVLQNGGGGA
jgi:hypothetical protein